MKCNRCTVNKPEVDFIKDGKIYKNCNSCREKENIANNNKKQGIEPIKNILRKDREKALLKGNFICSTCKKELPLSNFPNNATSLGFSKCSSRCKSCLAFGNKFSKIKRQYGISKEDFIKILELQQGKCKICSIIMETFSFKNNIANTLCIDHCHYSGKVRGFICNNCNRALGLFKDDESILLNAYNYIVQFKSDELLEKQETVNQQPS